MGEDRAVVVTVIQGRPLSTSPWKNSAARREYRRPPCKNATNIVRLTKLKSVLAMTTLETKRGSVWNSVAMMVMKTAAGMAETTMNVCCVTPSSPSAAPTK